MTTETKVDIIMELQALQAYAENALNMTHEPRFGQMYWMIGQLIKKVRE